MTKLTAPNKQALDKLTRARANLVLEQPFFGALALRLKLIERNDMSMKTLAVDGTHIFYDAGFINSLEPNLVKSAVGHEVGHCVFSHIARRGGRDPARWNMAGDYVVNEMLKDAGFQLGEKWLYDPAYTGWTADQIYAQMPELPPDSNGGGLCNIMDGDDEGASDPVAQAKAEREWKVATIQAASAAKMVGKLPKSLERFMDGNWEAKVDWRTLLRRFITQTAAADYTWSRANRRWLGHGHYLPRLYSENMGAIVVAVDTSGSIGDEILQAFGAEIKAIVQDVRPERLHVVYCDAAVNRVDEFLPDDDIKLVACGGGGTAFEPVADWIDEQGLEPVCVVYLTDLDGNSSFPEPPYPWLWCCISNQVAPWGETVKLEL